MSPYPALRGRPHVDTRTISRALLACGALHPLVYPVANDLIAATIYDGYSRVDQAISELSATNAPSKQFLAAMLPVFSLLAIGSGIGVGRVAGQSRALSVTGACARGAGRRLPVVAALSDDLARGDGGGRYGRQRRRAPRPDRGLDPAHRGRDGLQRRCPRLELPRLHDRSCRDRAGLRRSARWASAL